jgi:hypothetical protein
LPRFAELSLQNRELLGKASAPSQKIPDEQLPPPVVRRDPILDTDLEEIDS